MTSVSPICGLEDLWSWKCKGDAEPAFFEPILPSQKEKDESEVLVCHDMKGGYLPEELPEGCVFDEKQQPYTFLNWWNIDIFCYFSHNFVTIPPFEYTRLSHKHGESVGCPGIGWWTGCLSLGTFITEWAGGAKLCEGILACSQTIEDTVNSLVAVSQHFGFDGWLINIENEISEDQIPSLVHFLKMLTKKSREKNANSRIVWYDSVTFRGSLRWQNALNDSNKVFYDACDAIYLNYNWTDEMLLDSADFGEIHKIFVGIDVFARGCVGGFESWKSFATARLLRMSVALFAPGWICEKFPSHSQVIMGIKFWQKLYPYVKTRVIRQKEVRSNFTHGIVQKPQSREKRFQLSAIDLQPQCLSSTCYPVDGGLFIENPGIKTLFNFCCSVQKVKIVLKATKRASLVLNNQIIPDKFSQFEFGDGSTAAIRGTFGSNILDFEISAAHSFDLLSIGVFTYVEQTIIEHIDVQ